MDPTHSSASKSISSEFSKVTLHYLIGKTDENDGIIGTKLVPGTQVLAVEEEASGDDPVLDQPASTGPELEAVQESISEDEVSSAGAVAVAPDPITIDSYPAAGRYSTHSNLIRDQERVDAFRLSITRNKHLFKDKIVLNLDCGAGLFAFIAAKNGAKKVIAIDTGISFLAKQFMEDNKVNHVVEVIHGKIENFHELPLPEDTDKVDIIISNWMSYSLFLESTLDGFIYARDKWLRKDGTGLLFPSNCALYITGADTSEHQRKTAHFWNRLYGFDFSPMREKVYEEAHIGSIYESSGFEPCLLLELKMATVPSRFSPDLDEQPFKLVATRDVLIDTLVTFFNIKFEDGDYKVILSNGPGNPWTTYRQTLFYLKNKIEIRRGEAIDGTFSMKVMPKPQGLEFKIKVQFKGDENIYKYYLY